MKQTPKEHNVEYIKRLAKNIKREQNLSHHQALDLADVKIGFTNWKHFLHTVTEKNNKLSSKDNIGVSPLSEINPYRNLLVAGVNKLIEEKLISLNPGNIDSEHEKGHIQLDLLGYPSVIIWRNIGWDELSISVWWKYNHNSHPQANLEGPYKENFNMNRPLANKTLYKNFVGVVASCWLERMSGKYLQGENRGGIREVYTRKGELENLKKIPAQKAKGFKTSGPVHV